MSQPDPEAMQEFELLQRHIQSMERQLGAMEQSMMEIQQAITSLEAIESGDADGPVLVPIGAGVHVQATFQKDAAVVRPIGAETAIGGTATEALDALKQRRDALQSSYQQANAQLEQTLHKAQALQQRLSGA